MNFDKLQGNLDGRLAANSALSGIDRFIELDSDATPDELAAQDNQFALALAKKGMAITVLSPYGHPADTVYGSSAWSMTIPIAITENPEVNRATAAPAATPPTTPLGKTPLGVMYEIVRSIIGVYRFQPDSKIGRPTIGEDGLVHYYLLPVIIVKVS